MLVLTRKAGECIVIGDGIELRVVEIKGDHVRLGITAPRHISIHRQEVYLAIQAENTASSSLPLAALEQAQKLVKKR